MTRLRALVAAVLLGAAAMTLPGGIGAARAAVASGACTASGGVTVVVDFHQLGGGVQEVCDPGGGGEKAAQIFPESGFSLQVGPDGGVCQVAGEPAACRPMASDAYWSLWSAGPQGGSWTYAQVGASGLTVPNGGFVAFSWQGQSASAPPGVAPRHAAAKATPAPKPKPKPKQTGTSAPKRHVAPTRPHRTARTARDAASPPGPRPSASAPGVDRGVAASPSAAARGRSRAARPHASAAPGRSSRSASGGGSTPPQPRSIDPGSDVSSSQNAAWVAPVVIVVLLAIVAFIALMRRRRP